MIGQDKHRNGTKEPAGIYNIFHFIFYMESLNWVKCTKGKVFLLKVSDHLM